MSPTDLLLKLGIPTAPVGHHHVTPKYVGFDCPFCSRGAGKYRAGIHLTRLSCSCWVCGKLRLGDVLLAASGKSWGEIKRLLGQIQRLKTDDPTPAGGSLVMPPGILPKFSAIHEKYLRSRKFDPAEIAEKWGICGIGAGGGIYSWRLFIPIKYEKRTVSWTTRAISKSHSSRYRSARPHQEILRHKELLYGEDHVGGHTIIVTEGIPNVWRFGYGAVATFGVKLSGVQINRIMAYPIRVFVRDQDREGKKGFDELANRSALLPGETYVVDTSGPDLADTPEKEVSKLRRRFQCQ